MSDEQKVLVELYKAYNFAKEEFINRTFATNRYYLAVTIVLLLVALIIYTFTPSFVVMSVLGGVGIVTSTLWLLNVDSYQTLIKVKYSRVLERIEDRLPAKPCQDEYMATQEIKKDRKTMIFTDLQRGFVFMVLLIFVTIFVASVAKSFMVASDSMNTPEPPGQTVDLSDMPE